MSMSNRNRNRNQHRHSFWTLTVGVVWKMPKKRATIRGAYLDFCVHALGTLMELSCQFALRLWSAAIGSLCTYVHIHMYICIPRTSDWSASLFHYEKITERMNENSECSLITTHHDFLARNTGGYCGDRDIQLRVLSCNLLSCHSFQSSYNFFKYQIYCPYHVLGSFLYFHIQTPTQNFWHLVWFSPLN